MTEPEQGKEVQVAQAKPEKEPWKGGTPYGGKKGQKGIAVADQEAPVADVHSISSSQEGVVSEEDETSKN